MDKNRNEKYDKTNEKICSKYIKKEVIKRSNNMIMGFNPQLLHLYKDKFEQYNSSNNHDNHDELL